MYEDWQKSSADFNSYLISKYGSIQYATNNFKVYYDKLGNVVDETTYLLLPATEKSAETYYEYESRLNDEKGNIKLISPNLITAIESDVRRMMGGIV